jgi:hypothetical protein
MAALYARQAMRDDYCVAGCVASLASRPHAQLSPVHCLVRRSAAYISAAGGRAPPPEINAELDERLRTALRAVELEYLIGRSKAGFDQVSVLGVLVSVVEGVGGKEPGRPTWACL